MFRLFQIGEKILIALSFSQLFISLKFHLFTLMFFAKHSIIKRLTNIDLYYNTFRVRGIQWEIERSPNYILTHDYN